MSDTPQNFVIGLTGSLGSGCTTLSMALENNGFRRISLSDPIKDKFRELHQGKELTSESFGNDWRAELQDIGNRGRRGEFAGDTESDHYNYWIDLALQKVSNYQGDLVIDGIRNIGEVQSLRDTYPQSKFWLVAVYADYETRWNRIDALGLYPNERIFQRDDSRDSEEDDPCGQSVQRCVYEADYVFKNVENLAPKRIIAENLAKKLLEQISVMKEDITRNPTNAEVSMATAVSQSHASRCLRRKVGALIVDEEKGIPVSVGYNENPIGMESCFTLYNGLCYKDKIMETKLEAMGPLFCPECGKEHKTISRPWKCNKKDKDGSLCRCNFKSKFFPSRNMEICTAIHAEERAIRSLGGRNAEGCTLYVNTFPCLQCARYVKDADIRKVVYVEAYPVLEAVDFMKRNNIEIEPFEGFKPRVFNQVFKQIE
jgi:deoxycytidylate deaminase